MAPRSTNTTMAARQRRFPTSITPAETFAADELPFEQLSRMLATINLGSDAESIRLCNVPASYPLLSPSDDSSDYNSSLTPPSPIQANLSSDLAVTFNQQVLPHLQALFPRSAIDKLMLDGPEDADELNRYSSAQVQFLIYAATNNLPGISQSIPLTSIYDYLKEPVRAYFKADAYQLTAGNLGYLLPCTKPMAETMFRCGVEAGDHELVHQLLNRRELDLNANNHICTIDDESWTAVERSAALGHVRMVRMLIEMGADVDKTYQSSATDENKWAVDYGSFGAIENHRPCGALEHALYARYESSLENLPLVNLDMIKLLLQAGATFRSVLLNDLLLRQDAQAVCLLMSTWIEVEHRVWLENGYFHGIIHQLDQGSVMGMCDKLHDVGIDFDHDLARSHLIRTVWTTPITPPRLLDTAIERGFFELTVRLITFGASFTNDTVTAAVRSKDSTLVRYLLDLGAVPDCFSTHFLTTPIAEAVRLNQEDIYQLLVSKGCMEQIHEEYRFCSMLRSAAGSGDAEMVHFLLQLETPHRKDPRILGYALAKAAKANHTDIATTLVHTGASLDNEVFSRVLGCYYSYGSEGWIPISFALRNRNAKLFNTFLENCTDIHASDVDISVLAIDWGDASILDTLVAVGTPMAMAYRCAIQKGDLGCVRHLHSRGVTMSIITEDQGPQCDPLSLAIEYADMTMALEVLSYCIDLSPSAFVVAVLAAPTLLETLLQHHVDAERGRSLRASIVTAPAHFYPHSYTQVLRKLLEPRCEIRWITPLGAAILKNNGKELEILLRLLATAPSLDRPAIACRKMTPLTGSVLILETELLLAIGTCEPAMVLALLQHGANVNFPARGGLRRTPLQKAAEIGTWPVVELLLHHGADVNACPAERDGGTAIQLAAGGGYIGIAELLLAAGADIQAAGSKVHGRTPLEAAAEHGRYDMVRFLTLRSKYDDAQYETATAYAREKSHNAVADLLITICAERRIYVSAIQPYTCVNCNTSFSNAFTLQRHRRTACGDAISWPRHVCRLCSRVFKRKDMMDRHVAVHEGARVECPHCAKDFSRGDSLSNHRRHCRGSQLFKHLGGKPTTTFIRMSANLL
ncbi:hypothetical protein LTR10_005075 [Elasticomyces elasticus]|nr:hypothetical protein LTR10_005075 [Elasticomyces elasticus]KAK4975816.1 hypothetical protein LTR42_003437 [Elasticomyces elasticus]